MSYRAAMRWLIVASLGLLAACSDGAAEPLPVGAGGSAAAGGAAGEGGTPVAQAGLGGGGEGGTVGAPAIPCPADMVLAGETCIDRYEAPNEPGEPPLAMRTAYDGETWCAARGKRLCTDVEWIRACEGTAGTTYPYGDEHEAHRCNDDKTWLSPNWGVLATWPAEAAQDEAERLYQADPSGSRRGCASHDGAFDLTGNVTEWVTRTIDNATNYDHVMKGCYWAGCYGGTLPNCTFVNPAHPGGFRSYEAGFRCCTEPRNVDRQ
jgi:hypothetical protein